MGTALIFEAIENTEQSTDTIRGQVSYSLIRTIMPSMARKAKAAPKKKGAAGLIASHSHPATRLAGKRVRPTTP